MTDRETTPMSDPDTHMVKIRDLTKLYNEGDETRSVLRGVNADIRCGDFVALAGPSGSGKTTLLNLISGIDTPTGGDVMIDSVHVTKLPEKERTLFRRKNIGFVFQFFNLIPTLTIRENLLLPLHLNHFDKEWSSERVLEMLRQVALQDRLDSYPDRLSGGEKQRVAIARALVHDPILVLADEPTGNLDADTGMAVMSLLDGLVRAGGKTMIAVSHSEVVIEKANRVLAIENGQLVE